MHSFVCRICKTLRKYDRHFKLEVAFTSIYFTNIFCFSLIWHEFLPGKEEYSCRKIVKEEYVTFVGSEN